MVLIQKNRFKVYVISLVFILVTLFANIAHANTVSESLSTLAVFINKNIVEPIKQDFCRQYILSISNGAWGIDELRSNIGKKVCTSYTIPSNTTEKIATEKIQTLNSNTKVSNKDNLSTSSVNNPKPDIYIPSLDFNTKDLNPTQIFEFTNYDRKITDPNLVNLKENSILKSIATARVKDMFAYEYFEHNSPTGDNASKEAAKNGYTYITIGENIALGNFDGSRGLVTAWMNSPGHRANILNKNYTEIGVSAIKDVYKGQVVWIAAQIFGKPITGCNSPDKTLKEKIDKYKVSADSLFKNIQTIDAELKVLNANDVQTYNAKIAERNTIAKLYNNLATEIKTSVAEYNIEAASYNTCIKTL